MKVKIFLLLVLAALMVHQTLSFLERRFDEQRITDPNGEDRIDRRIDDLMSDSEAM